MAVENRLTQIIGEAGKKFIQQEVEMTKFVQILHFMYKKKTKSIQNQIKELISTFVEIASKHTTTIMPGMTHLQHAQPINFGFHMMAYANMFKRDFERFESSYIRNNYSPLGSAAMAGTPHNIDRFKTAELFRIFGSNTKCYG